MTAASDAPAVPQGPCLVVLATGGTIAGAATRAGDNVGYTAGQRGVAELLAAVPALAGVPIEAQQVAQVDSKDMGPAVWRPLLQAARAALARADVQGMVVTHGTDTLEETAWLLHRLLAPAKPLVLTAAMRPATALVPDGPQNLLDAAAVARTPGACGVLVVMAGQVHAGARVRKVHSYSLQALASADGGPLGVVEEGVLRRFQPWPALAGTAADGPADAPLSALAADLPPEPWPWVEIVTSHAAARGDGVRALQAAGVRGLVVAATGNGTVHAELAAALQAARDAGLPVWHTTRCAGGMLVAPGGGPAGPAAAMTPWQARLELQLRLLAAEASAPGLAHAPARVAASRGITPPSA